MGESTFSNIGRYEIRGPLGRGTMGVVYLAHDPALERPVALKTIDLAFSIPAAERESFEQRFLAEARVAARLSHPGIVVVHDVGRDPATGVLFIALEHLQGRTLAEVILQDAPLPWREALRITAGVARALHHAHDHGIVHRDVKPANVMLLPGGETKIMDFGIAKVPHQQLTSAGQFFGTPLFMAPEQARGEDVDGRADLFSLGAVAYALLTGRQAFHADNVLQVLERVTREQPAAPSSLVPGLPPAVDVLLARALAKAPEDRHPDGEAMARAAEDALAGREPEASDEYELVDDDTPLAALLAEPPAAPGPARPSPARRVQVLGWSGLALGLGGLLWLALRSPDPLPPAPREPAASVPATSREALRPPPTPRPPSPDKARLAVDFDHHLRSGTLRVWVDEALVMEEALDSRVTRKVLTVRLRKGSVEEMLDVEPGKRKVQVQVVWDDKVRTKWISGVFKAGAERTLEIRVRRILNELSLRWV